MAARAKPLEAELIPTLSSLEPVYGKGSQLSEARLRFDRLGARFEAVYGARPALFARSPGRSPASSELRAVRVSGYACLCERSCD
jgi:N-acetylgalactosamine kinase